MDPKRKGKVWYVVLKASTDVRQKEVVFSRCTRVAAPASSVALRQRYGSTKVAALVREACERRPLEVRISGGWAMECKGREGSRQVANDGRWNVEEKKWRESSWQDGRGVWGWTMAARANLEADGDFLLGRCTSTGRGGGSVVRSMY